MKSILIDEPASPGAVLIAETSDDIVEDERSRWTLYRGASTRIGPQWKARPSSERSGPRDLDQIVSDTVFHSVEAILATELSAIGGIERIFVRKDNDFFRVWIVIADADLALEDQIYDAQLAFMDRFAELPFDFAVIFRRGKAPGSICPSRARQVYPPV